MEETSTFLSTKRYAVVTGGNKGIGLEICKKLVSNGVKVILTSRDEKKGIEAVKNLRGCGLSDHVTFHQLDVVDPSSISSLAHFVKTQFGKLDILVNNAAIVGVRVDSDAVGASINGWKGAFIPWKEVSTQTYNLAEECLKTNYYGAKRMIEEFIPLLQLSDSPRIVNVSSASGKLKFISNEWAKEELGNAESQERVDEVLSEFLKDFKEGNLKAKGWPLAISAYVLSKAALNSYTRIIAKKYPDFIVNSVCPGYVKTSLNLDYGILTVEEGAESPVKLALLPKDGPSGKFFSRMEISDF
ncbi:hypothetical protein LguiB_010889 [Lonicera macranthoides]